MALSNALDAKAGVQTTQPKIISPRAENCPAPSHCQFYVTNIGCALEECPFRSPRELNAAGTTDTNGKQTTQTLMNASKKCCICGGVYTGFIGAVPICSSCMEKIKDVIVTPHCPGCGATVSRPHMLCGSCQEAYLKDEYCGE